jgi:serpin B
MARSGAAVQLMAKITGTPVSDPAKASAVSQAEQSFSLSLLDQVNAEAPSQNITVSPLSLSVALAMLENGARGATLSQIQATLHTSGLSPTAQDEGWSSVMATLSAETRSDGISLRSADSLWLQQGLQMDRTFMAALAGYYDTGVWQANFTSDLSGASDAINQWVSHQTAAQITQLFAPGDLDPTTELVLADAIYLNATWQTPFDPALSTPGPFHVSATQTTHPTFMSGSTPHTTTTSTYQLAELPYTGGHLTAVAIMPTGWDLPGFVQGLTASKLDTMIAGAAQPDQVYLPKFTTQNYLNLDTDLQAMGMPMAFSLDADFSSMSRQDLQIQSAVQRDYLSVGEKGTEAAAATGISMAQAVSGPGTSQKPINFDRPFLFLVRDTTTGTILFASLVNSPSS